MTATMYSLTKQFEPRPLHAHSLKAPSILPGNSVPCASRKAATVPPVKLSAMIESAPSKIAWPRR